MSYNSELSSNNVDLQTILTTIQNLPLSGSGSGLTYRYKADRHPLYPDTITDWVRPEGWPNLDLLPLPTDGTNCIYYTVDNHEQLDIINFVNLYISGNATIEYGSMTNGSFVSYLTKTSTGSNVQTLKLFGSTDPQYPIIKVTGTYTSCRLYGKTFTAALSPNGVASTFTYPVNCRVLLVVGSIPKVTSLYSSSLSPYFCGHFGQRVTMYNCDTMTGSMAYCFHSCRSLKKVLLFSNTSIKPTSMSYTFGGCANLISLDLRSIDVSNCTTFNKTFSWCKKLIDLNINGWNITNKCTGLCYMFLQCLSLDFEGIDFSGLDTSWDTSNVTTFGYMFDNCKSVKHLDVSAFDISKATSFVNMFTHCECLRTLLFPNTSAPALKYASNMFAYCYALDGLFDFSLWNPTDLNDTFYMFYQCLNIKKIKLGNMKIRVTNTGTTASCGCNNMFVLCRSLKQILWDMSGCDFSLCGSLGGFYNYCNQLLSPIDWSWYHGSANNTSFTIFRDCFKIPSITFSDSVSFPKVNTCQYMFTGLASVKTIDMSMFQFGTNITNMSSMFLGCNNVLHIYMPVIDTSKVTTIVSIFRYCHALKLIPTNMSTLDLSLCTSIQYAFQECLNLKLIDMSGWTTSEKLTSWATCVGTTPSCKTLNYSNMNISKVANASIFTILVEKVIATNTTTTVGNNIIMTSSGMMLREWYPGNISVSINISNAVNLDIASIQRIVDALQPVSTATTITFGAYNIAKLTALQIATIRGKGWTIA